MNGNRGVVLIFLENERINNNKTNKQTNKQTKNTKQHFHNT